MGPGGGRPKMPGGRAAVIRGLAPLPSWTRRFGELRGSGRAGSSRLERVLASWRDRMPQEVAEKRLDRRLRAWLPVAPVLQHEVRSESGLVGFVDAAFPDRKVGYELNSFRWHAAPRTYHRNVVKSNRLKALGWTIFEVVPADLRGDGRALAELALPDLRAAG